MGILSLYLPARWISLQLELVRCSRFCIYEPLSALYLPDIFSAD